MGGYVNLAYDYPVLGVFLSALWVFLWVLWIFLLVRVVVDMFRDDSLTGWAKAGWLLFVIVLPFLGVFVYLIARGKGMGAREMRLAEARQQDFDTYVRETAAGAGTTSTAEELRKLSDVHDKGAISDAEFQRAKDKILH